jgi:hypothetical protein
MARFVPDTDPELRSLLAACQAAEDPTPATAALADWLERRGDSRGPLLRLAVAHRQAAERLYADERIYGPHDSDNLLEAPDLLDRLRRQSRPVVEQWLGCRSETDRVSFGWSVWPLLDVDVAASCEALARLREAIRAGWVWSLWVRAPEVEEVLAALLPDAGPIRRINLGDNVGLRDADLRWLRRVPHLRVLTLCGTRVSDAGLRPLYRLRTLRALDLMGTRVTPAGLRRARAELPRCEVLATCG